MPWNKDGSRKSSPMYKMKGSPMQRNFGIKPSPAKWAFLAPVFAWLGGGATGAAATGATTAALTGGATTAAATTAGTAAATAAGKVVAGKAAAGMALSKAGKKKPKGETPSIASGMSNKDIMQEKKQDDQYA
tara:strand:+ start:83 stop:478 length:396 start_codon:yes stop_codon:yes gene_type:complete